MTAKRMAGNWFNVNNGAYCGIVMPEHVMKKLAKLYAKHNDEVKDLLTRHKDEIYPYEWTLAYPNGEQKTVAFNSAYCSVEERIEKYDENIKINRLNYTYNNNRKTYESEYGEFMSFDFTNNVLNMQVELIENEIDIDNIEELDTYETVETYDWQDVDTNRMTINELVQAVKQLDKKIREE